LYSAIAANKRNTFFIVGGFVLLLGGLAYWWGTASGNGSSALWIIAFVFGYALFQYFAASSLAIAMSGAHQIQKADNPRLWRIVENLSISQGMPMPKVYVINDPAPNAFATGRDPKNAVVAATTGLMDIMNDKELEGVMAHELGHVYLGGAPHCGFDTESGAPSSRWRACFDVAAEALLARLTAENGLPIDPYVAHDAQGGAPTQSDPDFTDRNVEERDLDRPFFVFELAWGLPSCGAVVDGEEYMSDEVAARYAVDQSGVCVGRQRSTMLVAGVISGGLQFATTNGCDCLTPTIDGGSSSAAVERFEIDRATRCLTANIGIRGAYVLSAT
jgi:hypothetical protein